VLTEISPAGAYLLASATMQFRNAEDARTFAALDHTTAFVAGEAETVTGYCWGYYLQRPDISAMAYVHELELAERHRRREIFSRAHACVPRGGSAARRDEGVLDHWERERCSAVALRHDRRPDRRSG